MMHSRRSAGRLNNKGTTMHLTRFLETIAVMLAIQGSPAALAKQTPREAPPTRIPIDVSKLGPQVGERVPDFRLSDQHGEAWTLSSVTGPNGAMLVFYRSADW
jgi:hypothetical protein